MQLLKGTESSSICAKDDGVPFPETEKEREEYSFRAIYDAENTRRGTVERRGKRTS